MRRAGLLLFLFFFLVGAAQGAPPDLRFKVTELGLPAGLDSVVAVNGLNILGDVVGTAYTPDGTRRAILWDHSQEVGTLLPLLTGCDQSEAFAVNDAGQVVGHCFNYSTAIMQACLWKQGAVQVLAPPSDLGPVIATTTRGINNQGQVVGSAYLSNLHGEYPMLWDNGPAQPLESPPRKGGKALCISNNGVVGGERFLWTKAGGFITIEGVSYGINGLGQTVGSNSLNFPCRWDSQSTATILAPLQYGTAYGINDLGQIVGSADSIQFLWQAGQVTDLNKSLLGFDWQSVIDVQAINNGMQIAGVARRLDSVTVNRAVLLNPVTSKPRFRLTDLGANLTANGINDRGEIVGNPAFFWHGGQLKSLPGSGTAYAINNAGKIVGSGYVGAELTAVSWDRQGNMTPLETAGTRSGGAFAVNLSGVAAGQAQNGSTVMPCIWKPDGAIQFLTTHQGIARGIADNNLVVGTYFPSESSSASAFACTVGGGFLDLLPGTSYSTAFAVNLSGQAVGYYRQTASSAILAFLWEGGKNKALSLLQGGAGAINFLGQVVGSAYSAYGGKQFAFLWDPDLSLMNLNDLVIPPQPDWNLTVATGINRGMQIIGTGTYQGVPHAFLLNRMGNTIAEVNLLLLK
jgi:uncharacterized membrane protein